MTVNFWGREDELRRLDRELEAVRSSGTGRMLAVRGRRQVGKSRLLTRFVEASGVPYVFHTAVKGAAAAVQIGHLARDLAVSRVALAALDTAFAVPPADWSDFFSRLALAVADQPSVVVLDEFPWAAEADPSLEGELQRAWDRTLESRPILLVLVGSDIATMERLTTQDRPLYGRAAEMVVSPLSPGEISQAFPGRHAVDVFDLALVTGGYPRLVSAAATIGDAEAFVVDQLGDDQSPLAVTGQRTLDAEFRAEVGARAVLEAIGASEVGHATFSTAVANLAGDPRSTATAITRALPQLTSDKRIVAIDTPVGAAPTTKLRRYRISDPYLRFWFRFVSPHLPDMARGRADLAVDDFRRGYSTWRGKAIEPIVHDGLNRMAANTPSLHDVVTVGAWWDRAGRHEFDVVAADSRGAAAVVGTVKWRPARPVTNAEIAEAAVAREVLRVPDAKLVVVCPAGVKGSAPVDLVVDAQMLLEAFAP